MAHGKGPICRHLFAVCLLPYATHSKGFAVGILAFAVWLGTQQSTRSRSVYYTHPWFPLHRFLTICSQTAWLTTDIWVHFIASFRKRITSSELVLIHTKMIHTYGHTETLTQLRMPRIVLVWPCFVTLIPCIYRTSSKGFKNELKFKT